MLKLLGERSLLGLTLHNAHLYPRHQQILLRLLRCIPDARLGMCTVLLPPILNGLAMTSFPAFACAHGLFSRALRVDFWTIFLTVSRVCSGWVQEFSLTQSASSSLRPPNRRLCARRTTRVGNTRTMCAHTTRRGWMTTRRRSSRQVCWDTEPHVSRGEPNPSCGPLLPLCIFSRGSCAC